MAISPSSLSSNSTSAPVPQTPSPLKRAAESPLKNVSNKLFKGLPQKQADPLPPNKVQAPLKPYQLRPKLRLHPEPELWFEPPSYHTLCSLLFSELDISLECLLKQPSSSQEVADFEKAFILALRKFKERIVDKTYRNSYKTVFYLHHFMNSEFFLKVYPKLNLGVISELGSIDPLVTSLSIEERGQLARFGFLMTGPNAENFRKIHEKLLFQDLSRSLDPRVKPQFDRWCGYEEMLTYVVSFCEDLLQSPVKLQPPDALNKLNMTHFIETPYETRLSAVKGVKAFCDNLLRALRRGEEIHLPFFYHGTSKESQNTTGVAKGKKIPKNIFLDEIKSLPELGAKYEGAFISTRVED